MQYNAKLCLFSSWFAQEAIVANNKQRLARHLDHTINLPIYFFKLNNLFQIVFIYLLKLTLNNIKPVNISVFFSALTQEYRYYFIIGLV